MDQFVIKKSKIEDFKPDPEKEIINEKTPRRTIKLGKSGCELYIIDKLPEELKMTPEIYERLWKSKPDSQEKIKTPRGYLDAPRYFQAYGSSYYFSGKLHKALPIKDEYMKRLLEFVNKDSGIFYNGILVNWYENGNHYIGPHSDDETGLKKEAIYCFSFGRERILKITPRSTTGETFTYTTPVKDNCYIMGAGMQDWFKHSITKNEKLEGTRMSFTFRCHKEGNKN